MGSTACVQGFGIHHGYLTGSIRIETLLRVAGWFLTSFYNSIWRMCSAQGICINNGNGYHACRRLVFVCRKDRLGLVLTSMSVVD